MKMFPECDGCLRNLTQKSIALVTKDESVKKQILENFDQYMSEKSEDTATIEAGQKVRHIIDKETGVYDPYQNIKLADNKVALEAYPRMQEIVEASPDPLLTSIRLAIAGNIIDFTTTDNYNINTVIGESLKNDFAIFHYSEFLESLEKASKILYLGDNAGEIVFDKLLVSELKKMGKEVIFAVRGMPAINDATLDDAKFVGMDELTEVTTTGIDIPGVLLKSVSQEFTKKFQDADLIISKGQGNFEGLSEEKAPLFFLFKAKCEPIANLMQVKRGGMVFFKSTNFN